MQCHTKPFSVKRQMFDWTQRRMERCKNEDSVAMTLHCRREEGGLEADRGTGTESFQLRNYHFRLLNIVTKAQWQKKRHLQKLCFLSVNPRNLREGWQQSLSGYWRFLSNVLWIEFEWICTCVRVFVFLNRLKPFCSLWQKRKGLGPTPQLHLTNGHLQYPTKPCNTLRVLRGIV